MSALRLIVPSAPRIAAFDVVLAGWAIFWVALAIGIAANTREIANMGDTVARTGRAVRQTGSALDSVPLLPSSVSDVASSIRSAGESTVEQGHSSADATRRLSLLLGIAIAIIPSVPVLGLYLPLRLFRVREARRVAAALHECGDDPAFREFLARRAAENLSFQELREISPQPWTDLAEARFAGLADAELRRLGLRADQRRRLRRWRA
jgi:hypothetical protein